MVSVRYNLNQLCNSQIDFATPLSGQFVIVRRSQSDNGEFYLQLMEVFVGFGNTYRM